MDDERMKALVNKVETIEVDPPAFTLEPYRRACDIAYGILLSIPTLDNGKYNIEKIIDSCLQSPEFMDMFNQYHALTKRKFPIWANKLSDFTPTQEFIALEHVEASEEGIESSFRTLAPNLPDGTFTARNMADAITDTIDILFFLTSPTFHPGSKHTNFVYAHYFGYSVRVSWTMYCDKKDRGG
jgi:hypothetical protein